MFPLDSAANPLSMRGRCAELDNVLTSFVLPGRSRSSPPGISRNHLSKPANEKRVFDLISTGFCCTFSAVAQPKEGTEGEEGASAPPAMVHSEFDLRFHIKWKNKGWTLVMGFDKGVC